MSAFTFFGHREYYGLYREVRKLLCASVVLVLVLSACSGPEPTPGPSGTVAGHGAYGIYELDFFVEPLPGELPDDWDFSYSYNGQAIDTGHRFLYSLELFTFYYIQVDVTGDNSPAQVFSSRLPVPIFDGGSGNTEVTVTGSDGRSVTFRITCNVSKVGEQYH